MTVIGLISGIIILLIFLGICAGLIILQIHLSKKESKWPGLIMPMITFGFSILTFLNMVVFVSVGTNYHFAVQQMYDENLQQLSIEEIAENEFRGDINAAQRAVEQRQAELDAERHTVVNHLVDYGRIRVASVSRIVFVVFIINLPTIVLLAIYAGCRSGHRKQRALDLMSLQDLR